MKKEMGSTLRELREKSGYTVKYVIDKLKEHNIDISDKALYSYESNKRAVSADTFLVLCEIYSCKNILETFSDIELDYSIPDDSEWKIIEKYRSLDPFGQETVSYVLDRELKRTKQIQATGKTPAAARIYTYMNKIACAGNGFYFEDIPTDTIEAPYMEDADFIIGVSGDSMEPTYHDGDLVYVQKAQVIKEGDIGIFYINNECYIKEAGENGLLSHNEKYKMIPGSEHIVCVGRVLGKVEM